MSTVGYATLDVIPSVRGLRGELQKQTSGDLTAAGKAGGKKFGDVAGKEAAGGFKGHLRTAAGDVKKMLASPLAGAAIGAGVVLAFKDVVGAASAAEQATGGVQAVFKEYAADVIADSRKAAQGLGLSATAYQELITLSGALLKNKGIADFADQAEALVKIGADLAAQFGGSTAEAVGALNSAMRGESDPIERYAISLNEAAIKTKLLENNQGALTGAALDQAKTQARLALIMEQSSDAAGAFGRESDTLAGQQARLSAEWADMRTELGQKVLPAMAGFVGFLNTEGIPALATAGGVTKELGSAIAELPAPVKAAATAFVALRIASASGLGDEVASGASKAMGALDSLRIRTMLAADAFVGARTMTRTFADTTARVSSGVGRMSASMSAARTAVTGMGGAMKSSLRGGMSLLGGPWGVALLAGTALVAKFWGEHQAAKAHIEALTDSLDAQTGAITENTEAAIFKALQDAGAIDTAREFGIALEDVRGAALGESDALARVNAEIQAHINSLPGVEAGNTGAAQSMQNTLDAADGLRGALTGQNEAVSRSVDGWRDSKAFMEGSAGATDKLSEAVNTYADALRSARDELKILVSVERARARDAIQNRRDQIALKEQLVAVRKEAREGKRTLNENTQAGRDNMSALLDLAGQWSNSTPKVQNARGAYEDMRRKFIEVAGEMGATKEQARKLADELLSVPKVAGPSFQSKGYKELMAQIAAIKAASTDLGPGGVDFAPRGLGAPRGTGPLSDAPAPSAATPDANPRGVVNNFYGGINGSTIPDVIKSAERSSRRRGHGGFGRP